MSHGVSRKPRIRDAGRHFTGDRRHREASGRTPPLRLVIAAAMALVVVVTSAALVLTMPAWVPQTTTQPERSPPPLPLFDSPVMAGLPPPGPSTRVPVNPVDRFTGKPITASSPTIPYKGYVVAFCCPHSTGYRGGWDRLSEAEKDTYVRGFLK